MDRYTQDLHLVFAYLPPVCAFLVGYVVPRFSEVYQGSGRSLPWMSELMLAWGRHAAQQGGTLLLLLVLALSAAAFAARRVVVVYGAGRLLASLPGVGRRARIYELSRLYLTLGMLLEGGIPVRQSLRLCGAVLDAGRQAALSRVREDVESGQTMSDALERHGLGTPVALRLLRAGEHSGQLGTMFNRTAAFYETETARWIERFTKAFEPILMAAIGIVIGLIVILLYMPIFDLAGSIQ